MERKLIVLHTYQSEVEAQLARGRLESSGIDAMVSSDDCAGMQPQFQIVYGVKLLVFEEDAKQARRILGIENDK
jgi:hypothetical protein